MAETKEVKPVVDFLFMYSRNCSESRKSGTLKNYNCVQARAAEMGYPNNLFLSI